MTVVIEVSPVPEGSYWRARLKSQPILHDAGDSIDTAISNLLSGLRRWFKGDVRAYRIEYV